MISSRVRFFLTNNVPVNLRRIRFSTRIFFLLIFSILLAANAFAQESAPSQNFHQWGAVTLFNGLPSDNVRAVAQTPDGILWFATDNGLAKFDGRRVSTVAVGDAAKILALKIINNQTLFIGTEKGAFRLENNQFGLIEATRSLAVTTIFQSNKIWLGTDAGVIFAVDFDAKTDALQTEKIPAENLRGSDGNFLRITGFAEIGGKIIAGTRSRSILVIENRQAFETFSRPRPFFVNALAQDKSGNVWLGADADEQKSGLFSLSAIENPVRVGADVGDVSALAADENGGVWVGTDKRGLFHFHGSTLPEHFTFENTAGGLRSNRINAIFVDRENVIWLGTNRGVSRFDASSPFNQTLSESGNSNFVRTVFRRADGQIFAGTNRGLFTEGAGNWFESAEFAGKSIYSVNEISGGEMLFSTSGGLLNGDGKQISAGDIRAAVSFQGKSYAAIFGRGVVQVENQNVIFGDDSPTALFANHSNLLIGTARGEIFGFNGQTFAPLNIPQEWRGAAIRKIFRDAENNLWIAGERGLLRQKNGEFEIILSGEDVRDFTLNGADIWAATLKDGLFHARDDERFGWLKSSINVEQGLPSEQIFSILPVENHLLIGTNRGVVSYAPSNVAPQITASRVLSQRLHDADEISRSIALDFPQNSLLVEVAGLSSRTFPEQFQYGFSLKNGGGEILENQISHEAQFSANDLAAGEYQIEAIAFNKDLLASAPLTISFSVARAPFPWTATALGILLAIALVALVWAIAERRRIAQKNRQLAAARFDLANEAERERKRIAQDLHDQTLADLRNLMMMSDKIPAETGDLRTEIEAVSTEIRRICEDLSPSVLENVGLIAALEFLLSHTIENRQFIADENSEERLNFSPNTQMQIYRIAQEILTNIKRHSDAKFVRMSIHITPQNRFVLSIEDDGKFVNPSESVHHGRGIANIKSRASIIEAKIHWQKSDDDGNVFTLEM